MRARGANALLAGGFEQTYGTPPTDFTRLAFVSSNLGEERPLLESDLLGFGREAQDPTPDNATNDGDVVVPVDTRLFGLWLRAMFGPPTTGPSVAASIDIPFSAQPANTSTITLAGTAFTFVSGAPTGNQFQIGANLGATLAAAVIALNASAVGAIAAATYSAVGGTKLRIVHDTSGPSGNAFTVTASANSNAKPPTATLTGGSNSHVFVSGAQTLPSMSLEIGMPDLGKFFMNYGAVANQMKIAMNPKGLLNATMSMVCQGEADAADSAADGSLTLIDPVRFVQATGSIKRDGVVLGDIVSANLSLSNNLDKIEVIRADGRIAGADPAMFMASGDITSRFGDTALLDAATSGLPIELSYGWTRGGYGLTFAMPRIFLPRTKRPITGPGGIQSQFNWQASGAGVGAHAVTATLVNDQDASVYA